MYIPPQLSGRLSNLPTTMPVLPKDRDKAKQVAELDAAYIRALAKIIGEGWLPKGLRERRRLCERILGSW